MTVKQGLGSHECLEIYCQLKEGLSKRQKVSMESVSGSGYGSGHLHPGLPLPTSRSGSFRASDRSRPGSFRLTHSRPGSFRCQGDKARPRQTMTSNSEFNSVSDDINRRESFPPNSFLSISYDDVRNKDGAKEPSLRRVRSFKTTSKGVVNRGDSFRKKGGRSITGITRDRKQVDSVVMEPQHVSTTLPSEDSRDNGDSYYKVVVLGANGVGKSLITQQFMTSEYIAFDSSVDHEEEENTIVNVLLNGEESTLEFIDDIIDYEVELETVLADAYMVVFSIAHRDTFTTAVSMLHELRHHLGTDRPAILVGNKTDLVRKRKVKTEEGLNAAYQYDAKYTETSAALNHHVDELLVGMLSQIRFKLNPSLPEPVYHVTKKTKHKKSLGGPFSFLSKFFNCGSKRDRPQKTKSAMKDLS